MINNKYFFILLTALCSCNTDKVRNPSNSIVEPISGMYFAIDSQIDKLIDYSNSENLFINSEGYANCDFSMETLLFIDSIGKELIVFGGGLSIQDGGIISADETVSSINKLNNFDVKFRANALSEQIQQSINDCAIKQDEKRLNVLLKNLKLVSDLMTDVETGNHKLSDIYLVILSIKMNCCMGLIDPS